MFSKNLRYYRLYRNMTKKELAQKSKLTPMSITNYEKGIRQPDMAVLKNLASVLGVRVSDFLLARDENISFRHGEFRKNSSLSNAQQEFIRESVEEYFSRFMSVLEILGGEILPVPPACNALQLSQDVEVNALRLRTYLGFSVDGSIEDLIGKLEDRGILVYECNIDNNKFSGMNGLVDGRPYIVVNTNMSAERNRSTVAHELAHLMFSWPLDMPPKEIENEATAISGAFLFPKSDVIRELGIHRSAITSDMLLVAVEYGISMMLLAKRAKLCNVISDKSERNFYIIASKAGWRNAEPQRINKEKSMLFQQLVYRAVSEEEITVSKGAELLRVPLEEIRKNSSREIYNGVY